MAADARDCTGGLPFGGALIVVADADLRLT